MDYRQAGMKRKTIKAVIRKKIDEWLATIECEATRELAAKNTIVTGGAIASMVLGEKVNDFDLYLRNKETVLALANYYVNRFEIKKKSGIECKIFVQEDEDGRVKIVVKSSGIASEEGADKPYEYFENSQDERAQGYVSEVMQDPGAIEDTYEQTEQEDEGTAYRPIFLSTNAITLSRKVQLILRFYGDPDEIHTNYDFVHCTSYWTSWDSELVLRPEALEALLCRELRYVGSKYPVCSLIRLRKFIKRGWTINAGQIVKMVMQISDLDLKDVKVLEEQLTGVDVAYFIDIINRVKQDDPEKVNSAYLIEIIDRMF